MPTAQWTANLHYSRNVLLALRALVGAERPEVMLLTSMEASPENLAEIAAGVDGVLHFELAPRWVGRLSRWKMACRRRLGLHENALGQFLRKNRIDALFGGIEFGPDFQVPLVTWIADFQHVRMPEMFAPEELADRDVRLHRLAKYADRIILNSHDVLADLKRFDPAHAAKARVASFVAMAPDGLLSGDPAEVCRTYNLPERFIYLPNQFWRHKNHTLVVRALCRARETCPDVKVVCSGNTNDYRNPGYFGGLLAELSRAGMREHMIVLGAVPHADVFRLLRQSVAVLQPSLFEGWNTAVEECKSVGKATLVSDIAVHREQHPPRALYFPPTDERAMAGCLCRAWRDWKAGPDAELEAEARRALPARAEAFGRAFMATINEAIGAKPGRR